MVQDRRERGKPRESQVKGGVDIIKGFLEEASEMTKSLRAQGSKASKHSRRERQD